MSLEQDFINSVIKGSSKDLLEAFDRNFERKAFFDKKWPSSRNPKRGGLQQRGTLRDLKLLKEYMLMPMLYHPNKIYPGQVLAIPQ